MRRTRRTRAGVGEIADGIVARANKNIACDSARSAIARWVVVREEIETVFEKRLLTGAVINVGAAYARRLFHKARRTVVSRVTNTITEHRSVSVNTVRNTEFMLWDETDVKSFATRNQVLFMSSNVREWYVE